MEKKDETLPAGRQEFLPTDLPDEIPAHVTSTEEAEHFYPKTLLSWSAPGRPYKKRGKQFYMTSVLLALLLEVILFLFSQYMLMLVVVSLVFLAFTFALVPPRNFHYRISTEGLTIEDHSYLWQELYDFYFKKREGVEILTVSTRAYFPGELSISLGDVDRHHLTQVMSKYLPYREVVKPTFMEKGADWMVKNFPLERASN